MSEKVGDLKSGQRFVFCDFSEGNPLFNREMVMVRPIITKGLQGCEYQIVGSCVVYTADPNRPVKLVASG